MSEDSDQEKVRKFVKDPKTIKKAVESSMDKRAAKLYLEEKENPLETEAIRGNKPIIPETIEQILIELYKGEPSYPPEVALDRINTHIRQTVSRYFNDGRNFERHFQDWKAEALFKDEPVSSGTTVNGQPIIANKAEIRNELRAELREEWKTAKFKGKLSKRLKSVMKGGA